VRTRRAVVAALLVATTVPAAPAHAHQNDPTIVTRIDAVTPPQPHMTIEVRAGVADQLLVVNATGRPMTVLATGGEPFLRIGPDTVQANVASPDWYLSNSPFGAARVPPTATPDAKPDWRTVAKGHSWGWFDHRMHATDRPLTPALRRSRTPVRLAEWSVPFRHASGSGAILGHVEYRPLLGAFRTRVERAPADVKADVLDGRVPGLFLRWQGAGTLVVRGIEGEPFARLTPQGTEVNDASPTWQDDQRLRGAAPPATTVDPRGVPRWRRIAAKPTLTWLDRRLAYAPGFPPDDVASDPHPTTLVEWDVPVEIAGEVEHLRGTTTWQPNDAGGGGHATHLAIAAAVVAALAGVAGLLVLRRRSREVRPASPS
jgi:hypothetical protein